MALSIRLIKTCLILFLSAIIFDVRNEDLIFILASNFSAFISIKSITSLVSSNKSNDSLFSFSSPDSNLLISSRSSTMAIILFTDFADFLRNFLLMLGSSIPPSKRVRIYP